LASKVSTRGHFTLLNKPSKRSLRLCHLSKLAVQKKAARAPLKQVMTLDEHLHRESLCGNFHAMTMAAKNSGWV
jgi:hypothetical protein